MAVTATVTENRTTGDGSEQHYTFTFHTLDTAHVKATVDGVAPSFTVVLNGNQEVSPGGTVTFGTAPALNSEVRIYRETAKTQSLSLTPYAKFPATALEGAFDKLALEVQDAQARIDQIKAPFLAGGSGDVTPNVGSQGRLGIYSNPSEDGSTVLGVIVKDPDPATTYSWVTLANGSDLSTLTTTVGGHETRITSLEGRVTNLELNGGGGGGTLTDLITPVEFSGTHAGTSDDAAVYLPWTAPDTVASARNPPGVPGIGVYEGAQNASGAKIDVIGGDGGRTNAEEYFSRIRLQVSGQTGAGLAIEHSRGSNGTSQHTILQASFTETAGKIAHAPQAAFGDQAAPLPGFLIFAQRALFTRGAVVMSSPDNSLWRVQVSDAGELSADKILFPSIPSQDGANLTATATAEGVFINLVGLPDGDVSRWVELGGDVSGPAGAITFTGVLTPLAGQNWSFYCYENDTVQPAYRNVGGPVLVLTPVTIP